MSEFISIEKLHPHPDNPRKDLGDLTELSESIKAKGIYQNLTVVPCTGYYYGDYTVIIGHRRLAAAKLAGLSEVPCVITEMDEKEQIATMLLENMQRSDLTVYEQAKGIQLMLDLGDTVNEISEKTGFSESTIRRRTKLLQLDENAFRDSQERQVTLAEYDKLFEIEDEGERNSLLEDIGTQNFNNRFLQIKSAEERERKRAELVRAVSEFAIEKSDKEVADYSYVKYLEKVEDIPSEREDVQYFYSKAWGSALYLYRDYTDEEIAEVEENERQRAEDERLKQMKKDRLAELDELAKRFFKLRFEFVKGYNPKNNKDELIRFAAYVSIEQWTYSTRPEMLEKLLAEKVTEENSYRVVPDMEICKKLLQKEPERFLFYATYSRFHDDSREMKYHEMWSGKNKRNETLDGLYKYLCDLGYEMSDEEKAYRDGTHELFLRLEDDSQS